MSVAATLEAKLTEALAPVRLAVIDDSQRHAGHAGSRPGGETHFTIEIVSAQFEGKSRLERQRLVYGIVAGELAGQVHALSMRALTPAEDAKA